MTIPTQVGELDGGRVDQVQAAQWLSQAVEPTAGIDITQFLQFGLLGLIFACVIAKKFLVPEWTLRQSVEQSAKELALKDERIAALEADKAELKVSLEQLQSLTRDQIIPALVRSNQLSADYVSELAQQKRREHDDER